MSDEARDLVHALTSRVRGEVRFDEGSRALYATAASNYRQLPIGVVVPADVEDAAAAVEVCRRFEAPIVHRGGGTSLAGQTCNHAVVIDFSKHVNRIVELDSERRFAVVEPGVILDQLRDRAEAFHLTFGPDPATHNRCTLGGMIGNNSCGVHSVMAGCTASNVEELEILTYDGLRLTVGELDAHELDRRTGDGGPEAQLYQRLAAFRDRHASAIRAGFPNIPRRVSGYNLPALLPENGSHLARALVGSEGTLVTVLRAKVRLVPSPAHRLLVVIGYPSVFEAADRVGEVLEARPIGLEGLDDFLIDSMRRKHLHPDGMKRLPQGKGWLLAELGGDSLEEVRDHAHVLARRLARTAHPPNVEVVEGRADTESIWAVRESGLGATTRVPGQPDTWEGWEDSAVPPAKLGEYLRAFRGLLDQYHYEAALYGHFGQGCVHTRIPFDLRSTRGVAKYRSFVEHAADLVVSLGGSLSGEHGDGQSRAELLPRMFGPELMQAFGEFKAIWDPSGKMNPGKVVNPARLDQHLRLGGNYKRPERSTHFRFPEDRGSFAYATERCVGVGECRRLDGGTMCPSFMVTREEAHSTRGRAHLLFEVMRGGITEGFRSDAVREALDLCLACKGCKNDCPVNVDVATYKAEYLAHYYEGRLRPVAAYLFGLIHIWARVGSLAPRLVNWLMRARGVSPLLKRVTGIAQQRTFPALARQTFRAFWRSRQQPQRSGPEVLLWVDTFNNYWQPSVLRAAVEVLEHAGFRVLIAPELLCCGRPLYDFGMLRRAKKLLRETLDVLRPFIRAGIPVVGLEPSCVAVFRDELHGLFPDDPDAQALHKQVFMLDELLQSRARDWSPPRLTRPALVHGHCHQKAVLRLDDHRALLERIGLEAQVLDAGCCGMAGGFGYERARYAVSIACGERKLLPAVRGASEEMLVVADGFSCREQIRQQTGRQALHLAQVLQMAKQQGPLGPRGSFPEAAYVDHDPLPAASLRRRAAAGNLTHLFVVALALLLAGC